MRHFHEAGHLHELTFSCYRRMPLLTNDSWWKEPSSEKHPKRHWQSQWHTLKCTISSCIQPTWPTGYLERPPEAIWTIAVWRLAH